MTKDGEVARTVVDTDGTGSVQLKPAQVHKLYLTSANEIAQAISRGAWKPGDKLPPERELARMLDVSRSTLRQALAALEALSVIRIRAGVGAFIQEEALEIIEDELVSELVAEGDPMMLVEARLCIEPGMALLAAENHEVDDLVQLKHALEQMDRFQDWEGGVRPVDFIQADIDFHMSIAVASKNAVLIRLYEQLVDQMRHRVWIKAAVPVIEKRAASYQEDHTRICEAIQQRQEAKARQLMREHLRGIQTNLRSLSSITGD